MYKKEYSQLTFADDYMFCKILSSNKDLCKELLELTLGIRINRLEITENQVSMEHKFDARGIRLDIYVEDDNGGSPRNNGVLSRNTGVSPLLLIALLTLMGVSKTSLLYWGFLCTLSNHSTVH